jgi:acyl carrier protein
VSARLSPREEAVAREILRIARDDLAIPPPPEGGVPLASGLDSLALLSLVVAVEDRFRVVLTETDAGAAASLEDLARIVAARAAPELLPAPAPDAPAEAAS